MCILVVAIFVLFAEAAETISGRLARNGMRSN